MLEYADVNMLAVLLGTSKSLAKRLEDGEIWSRCISNQGSATSMCEVAQRIFKNMSREYEPSSAWIIRWLSPFCRRMQAYHMARRLWKIIISSVSVQTTCSLREPASEKELGLVEEYVGWRIPVAVRSSLMVCDGQDVIGVRMGIIHGLPLLSCAQIWNEMRWRPSMKKNGFLPITAAQGHQQICCTREGNVVLLEGKQCHFKSHSFFHFLATLFVDGMDPLWKDIGSSKSEEDQKSKVSEGR
mmetsp:Transcript_19051/g.26801  ORF Transcript_19051/g.26801 Transcript_19051/m.26801 type:complete len:243 (-) Transcript_19051:107-835(-)